MSVYRAALQGDHQHPGRLPPGYVCDTELELPEGRVCALWAPGPWRWLGLFGHDGYYRIPWSCVQQVGSDMILINADLSACRVRRRER